MLRQKDTHHISKDLKKSRAGDDGDVAKTALASLRSAVSTRLFIPQGESRSEAAEWRRENYAEAVTT